jgi:hypothetical protein
MSEPDECSMSDPAIREQFASKRREQRRAEALSCLVAIGREHVEEEGPEGLRAALEHYVDDYGFDHDTARDVVGEALEKIGAAS